MNEARLTSSRSTDSANTGGEDADESSVVDVIGVEDYLKILKCDLINDCLKVIDFVSCRIKNIYHILHIKQK